MTPQRVALKPRSRSKEEEERLRVSKTINAELMKKVNFREVDVQKEPRTCHSLERNHVGSTKDEQDDFILVLSDGDQQDEKVAETIDHWASSAEESQDEARIQQIRRRLKGKLSGVQSSQSSESVSSGNTVIHNVVKNKAGHFEKVNVDERET